MRKRISLGHDIFRPDGSLLVTVSTEEEAAKAVDKINKNSSVPAVHLHIQLDKPGVIVKAIPYDPAIHPQLP